MEKRFRWTTETCLIVKEVTRLEAGQLVIGKTCRAKQQVGGSNYKRFSLPIGIYQVTYPDQSSSYVQVHEQSCDVQGTRLGMTIISKGKVIEFFNQKEQQRPEDPDAHYCPMDGSYVCQCARVKKIEETLAVIVVNGNLMLDYLKALIQTTDDELVDILPRKIQEVQGRDQSRS